MYKNLRESDPGKYPPRIGQKWTDEEVSKLLISIRKKKPIEAIAAEHERTVGGINAERRKLAADYWFNDQRPIEEIMKFTGLSAADIDEAIKRRQNKEDSKEKKDEKKMNAPSTSTVKSSAVELEIYELKCEIMQMKKSLGELMELVRTQKKTPLINAHLATAKQ